MKLVSSQSPSDAGARPDTTTLVVASPAMTRLLAMAESAAKSPATVLLTGESGVGKDLIARHIHNHSSRRVAPFVGVNCAGLSEVRLESELFGHIRGPGKLRLAHRGTLFLDECGDMIRRMQAWLMRFLENSDVSAVGSEEGQAPVDVRVIAATNRNLDDLVAAGQFREDLLYRLRVIHLHVPPLRDRPEDVCALITHFLARADRELSFTADALRRAFALRVAGQRSRTPERRRTARLAVGTGTRRGRTAANLDSMRTRAVDGRGPGVRGTIGRHVRISEQLRGDERRGSRTPTRHVTTCRHMAASLRAQSLIYQLLTVLGERHHSCVQNSVSRGGALCVATVAPRQNANHASEFVGFPIAGKSSSRAANVRRRQCGHDGIARHGRARGGKPGQGADHG